MVPLFGLFQLYLNGADLTPEFRAKLALQWVWIKPWKGLNWKMMGLFWNLKGLKQSLKIWLSYKWPFKKEPIWLSEGHFRAISSCFPHVPVLVQTYKSRYIISKFAFIKFVSFTCKGNNLYDILQYPVEWESLNY